MAPMFYDYVTQQSTGDRGVQQHVATRARDKRDIAPSPVGASVCARAENRNITRPYNLFDVCDSTKPHCALT